MATIEPKSPARLIELATGYQRSKILFAFVALELPTWLAGGPRGLDEVAGKLGADPLAIERFLDACVTLGLVIREGDAFHNSPESQRFLVGGAPTDLGDLFRRYERDSSSEAWARLAQQLRSWRPGTMNERLLAEHAAFDIEIRGQHQLSLLAGEALAWELDLSAHRCLLDLGGGTGAMAIALCQQFQALRAIVIELPAMVPEARARVRECGLEDRIEVRAGDLVVGPLPGGCDIVLLANMLSLSSCATNRALLRRIFQQLPVGGTVLLSGWMLDDDRPQSILPALFCLEDIVLGAPDVERSVATYAEWLAEAGFQDIGHTMYFEPASLIVGHKR